MDSIGFNLFFDSIEKLGFLVSLVIDIWFLIDKIKNRKQFFDIIEKLGLLVPFLANLWFLRDKLKRRNKT